MSDLILVNGIEVPLHEALNATEQIKGFCVIPTEHHTCANVQSLSSLHSWTTVWDPHGARCHPGVHLQCSS